MCLLMPSKWSDGGLHSWKMVQAGRDAPWSKTSYTARERCPPKTDSPSATYELVPFESERQLSHGMTRGELTAIQPEPVAWQQKNWISELHKGEPWKEDYHYCRCRHGCLDSRDAEREWKRDFLTLLHTDSGAVANNRKKREQCRGKRPWSVVVESLEILRTPSGGAETGRKWMNPCSFHNVFYIT